jgi:hypothetical protein
MALLSCQICSGVLDRFQLSSQLPSGRRVVLGVSLPGHGNGDYLPPECP